MCVAGPQVTKSKKPSPVVFTPLQSTGVPAKRRRNWALNLPPSTEPRYERGSYTVASVHNLILHKWAEGVRFQKA